MTTWALIPCSKTKAERPCTAREMYWPSALFRGAWRVAEIREEQPLILSAKYGLLWPTNRIEPYDQTLATMSGPARALWRTTVIDLLRKVIKPGDKVVSYLGAAYAEGVVGALRQMGCQVEEPLKGLGQGRRLAWFKRELESLNKLAG